MMALLRKSRQLQLPISCQLDLFSSLVMPILTYGCEVRGNNCVDIAESLHLEYCKYILRLKKSTPNCFIYGETGHFPQTSNRKLPIEKGRHMNIPQEARLCHLCDMNRVGDEYHFYELK
ncbi:uncharacterized protein LOC143298244 [Babylonia areolata]|uniref:uncharacterized protein LOC143298244 n=1 Tax=Babylonia areolata TaxID=304850 RepID=UPI003FD38C03